MNLGDGLLFELENGKPKLILLSHGVEKNPAKLLFRPRAANILSSRQPSCLEDVQGEERPAWQQAARCREARSGTGGAAGSFNSNNTNTKEGSITLTALKTHKIHNGGGITAVTKVKSDGQKQCSNYGSLRAKGKTGRPQNSALRTGAKVRLKDRLSSAETGQKDNVVVLTNEQLQRILSSVHTSSNGQQTAQELRPQGSEFGATVDAGGGGMEEDTGGAGEETKKEQSVGGVNDTSGSSQEKEGRMSGSLFSWLEERHSDARSDINTKKAQWRRELDEQVALKQQQKRSAPDRCQAEEDTRSVLSFHSSISHREQHAAIRSSLKLGDITPMEEVMNVERKEEQKRRWLEELDRQKEETAERRRQEKRLQNQTEDHELWTTHFDSLQKRPMVHTTAPSAPPPAPSCGSERGEWEPSSSLSLWEATSSCGAESVIGTSVDMTNRFPSRASHLRTMTALLDPAQIEERERRRLKQLEQQRVIEAQMEERRRQKEQEQARRKREEEEEAQRVAQEREMIRRQYELDTLRQSQKQSQQDDKPKKYHSDGRTQETVESTVTTQSEHLEEDVNSSVPPYKDTAVQTEEASFIPVQEESAQTPGVSAQYQPPAPAPNSRNPTVRTGKENICQPGGGDRDPYEPFARTERSKRDKKRPEWNTQRPSRPFVPASERYPVPLQRNRQESRLKRQAELIALQERACMSRTELPPPLPPQHQDPRLCSNSAQARNGQNTKREAFPGGQTIICNERPRVLSQQAANPLPPLVQEFVPYIRTDEITLEPLEATDRPPLHTNADAPPPPLCSASPLASPHTQRQQEILRGLAQLRQGLLQKQRELETDLNPLLKRHDRKL